MAESLPPQFPEADPTRLEMEKRWSVGVVTMSARDVRDSMTVEGERLPEKIHEGNQDYALERPWGMCVADGVGSVPGGEVASWIVSETFADAIDHYATFGFAPNAYSDPNADPRIPRKPLAELSEKDVKLMLDEATKVSYDALLAAREEYNVPGAMTGFGIVIHLSKTRVAVVNMGDITIKHLRDNSVQIVSQTQSVGKRVMNVFGGKNEKGEEAVPDTRSARIIEDVKPGDMFLAYTDGVATEFHPNAIDDVTVTQTLKKSRGYPERAARAILTLPETLLRRRRPYTRFGQRYERIVDDRTVGVTEVYESRAARFLRAWQKTYEYK